MSGQLFVHYTSLDWKATALERMAGDIALAAPRIGAAAVRAGLHELVGFGIFSALPVAADLVALCTPGVPGSLPDLAAQLLALSLCVRAAELAYHAVDAARWARAELPTAEALIMLAAWNRLHRIVDLNRAMRVPVAPEILDWAGEHALEQADHLIEGSGSLREVDPARMPPLDAAPATGLASLLKVVNTISDAQHPSTAALLHIGDDPPRYVLCLPGVQDASGADGGSADLPGALATLAGHSAYIRGMRALLATLPDGAQVLLVGHSQGGMVAEALAATTKVGHVTIAGVFTAGTPTLAAPVDPRLPCLALRNRQDPVPKLGMLASGVDPRTVAPPRGLVEFGAPGFGLSGSQHGLGSGGYLKEAGSSDPRVTRFASRVARFLTTAPVGVRYVQVTDSDGPLPP